MAHMKCKCGNRLSNGTIPNHVEGHIRGIFELKEKDVWECDNCGRLTIFLKKENQVIAKTYIPEDGKPALIFDDDLSITHSESCKKEIERLQNIIDAIEKSENDWKDKFKKIQEEKDDFPPLILKRSNKIG